MPSAIFGERTYWRLPSFAPHAPVCAAHERCAPAGSPTEHRKSCRGANARPGLSSVEPTARSVCQGTYVSRMKAYTGLTCVRAWCRRGNRLRLSLPPSPLAQRSGKGLTPSPHPLDGHAERVFWVCCHRSLCVGRPGWSGSGQDGTEADRSWNDNGVASIRSPTRTSLPWGAATPRDITCARQAIEYVGERRHGTATNRFRSLCSSAHRSQLTTERKCKTSTEPTLQGFETLAPVLVARAKSLRKGEPYGN